MTHRLLAPALALAAASLTSQQPAPASVASPFPALPRAIASFGAAGVGSSIYAFGGHIGKAHAHSKDNVIGLFQRLDAGADQWAPLPGGPKLQGTALVATPNGRLIRVGGMTAYNELDDNEDMESLASVQRFDPAKGQWEDLTPLPEGRSSHDAYVLDDTLFVIGGWTLEGNDGDWLETAWAADLSTSPIRWRAIAEPPTIRRALTIAPLGTRIAAIGGLDDYGDMTRKVELYDPATDSWQKGPDFPGRGFGASAVPVDGALLCSGMDGDVYRLDPQAKAWSKVARLQTPRFFHRLVKTDRGVFALGGAGRGGHMATIEKIHLRTERPRATRPASRPTRRPATEQHDETPTAPAVWQGLRGDGRSHAAPGTELPREWDETTNMAWSSPIAGYGQSCPVIYGDRVFVTSGVGDHKETCVVTCFDVASGKKLWERTAPASHRVEATRMTSRAAPSPVVDGDHVYAFFESGDIMAFTHDGEAAWRHRITDLFGGAYQGNHGFGSSLALSSVGVVLLLDHDGPSLVATFARDTGDPVWVTDRTSRISWSTPLVIRDGDREEIIVSSNGSVDAYDPTTGERLWTVANVEGNTVPSPTWAGDLIVVGASKGDNLAIRCADRDPKIAWTAKKVRPCGFCSPVVLGGRVYVVNKSGVMFAVELASGKLLWKQRLPEPCWATPVAVGDLLYCFGKSGTSAILRPGAEGAEILAESFIETTDSVYGVALAGNAIVLREGSLLRCIRTDS